MSMKKAKGQIEPLSNKAVRLMEEITNFIRGCNSVGRRDVSFVDLSEHVEGFKGDCNYMVNEEKCPNVILWVGVSIDAVRALCELLRNKVLDLIPCDFFTYLLDGVSLRLPIAGVKRFRGYKELHWLPVVFNLAA